jgi:hypothetical protein
MFCNLKMLQSAVTLKTLKTSCDDISANGSFCGEVVFPRQRVGNVSPRCDKSRLANQQASQPDHGGSELNDGRPRPAGSRRSDSWVSKDCSPIS